jgi:hypothetical protein
MSDPYNSRPGVRKYYASSPISYETNLEIQHFFQENTVFTLLFSPVMMPHHMKKWVRARKLTKGNPL